MRTRVLALPAAAVLAVAMIAGPGIAWNSDSDTDAASSEAQISLVDCVVESSKDVSYVAFLDDGDELDKFNVNSPSYDLTAYDGIDDVTSVRVKSGQTVESFSVDCADADEDGTVDEHGDDEDGDDVTEPDEADSHNDSASTNSQAVITLSGCTVNSSKDISYVAFFDGGEQLDKDEIVGTDRYDLTSFGAIDDVTSVRVKAGTTVATFSVNCGTAHDDATGGTAGDDEHEDDSKDEDADTHGDDDAKDESKDDEDEFKDDTADTQGHDDDANKDDDSDKDADDDDVDEDDSDDDDNDDEWDARHDGRHEHKDHEEK